MYDYSSTVRKGKQIAKDILRQLLDDCHEQGVEFDSLFDWQSYNDLLGMVDDAHAELNLSGSDEDALTIFIIDDLENGGALQDLWTHNMNEVLATIIEVEADDWMEE